MFQRNHPRFASISSRFFHNSSNRPTSRFQQYPTMSDDCSFSVHIKKMCKSARNMCAWILRTFKSRSPELMMTTWKSLVQPILDYCSQLWSPSKKGLIQEIEDIQRSFSRKVSGCAADDYWKRLEKLHLYSLERRRERYQIIYVWKAMEKIVPHFIDTHNAPRHGRLCNISPLPTNAPGKICSLREQSLRIHGAKLFNVLPRSIRDLANVDVLVFKKKLDGFLGTIPDEPQCHGYTDIRRAESNSLLKMIPAT